MVREAVETVDELLAKYEHQAQTYWDFMSQEEREEYAWVAGLIDGEGCIDARSVWNKRTGVRNYDLRVRVEMTHKATIEAIKSITKVGALWPRSDKRPHRRPIYQWACWDKEAAWVLRRCLPFLVTKKAEAILGIEFAEGIEPGRGKPLSPATIAKRESLIRAIRALKHNG